ncbi:hypothetical protein ACOCEA_16040 [Maribacter sp. CXY002]|uniref:hypothetical protein n=1 Tax=Maribacter luteocoastalis TaxID=3407671 RepID=UPI003B67EC75
MISFISYSVVAQNKIILDRSTNQGFIIKKTAAYYVLTNKCNICHAAKKRQSIFTLHNMDSLSEAINLQVFIKKKMPKGKKNKLTLEDERQLKAWLNSL